MRTSYATDATGGVTPDPTGRSTGHASTVRYALAGLLSAAGAMAAGHAVAGLVEPSASPVLAVGTAVIDATPTAVKTWAVDTFGTADKPILIAGVAVVTALLAATAGILSRRHPWVGAGIVIALGLLSTLAAHLTVGQSQVAILPGVIATIVGVALLSWLTSLAARADARGTPHPSGTDTNGTRDVERPTDHVAEPGGASPAGAGADRRTFVIGSIGVAAAAAGLAAVGQVLARPAQLARAIVLPPPTGPLGPLPTDLATEVSGISPLRTPTADFYRIDTALTLPRVDLDSWRLRIDGDVDNPYELSFDDLLAMPLIERDITLNCVSNGVGGPYIGSTRWLARVSSRCPPTSGPPWNGRVGRRRQKACSSRARSTHPTWRFSPVAGCFWLRASSPRLWTRTGGCVPSARPCQAAWPASWPSGTGCATCWSHPRTSSTVASRI